ncbi:MULTISPECIES: TrkA family potassium uptake protein [Paraburkholderia]|uniref:NAD-binding protein n=1 Tax=Paraburkholderia madseniana TaxID=2599607 RepID=A0AAP5BAP0_9BURK|nr:MULTISPECIES: NAD(P)-binding protein [Paraburkholderia]MCX4145250.1 NAD-binding protein [Paraburkholderia madseniana]MDN7148200.1 NAD-binding protein [Paraburkholderia sp. WS6]MDQ6407080.1 NAD-binding protein [Paraburkholderia madseniana]
MLCESASSEWFELRFEERIRGTIGMYRIEEPRLGGLRIKEWRRRARLAVGLLFLVLLGSSAGLVLLDHSDAPLPTKMFTALWDAVNLVTTLGDFSDFNPDQKIFMLVAILATVVVAGYALRQLTGILSGDDVMVFWENRAMEHKLETLSNHVTICPFGPVGQLVAARLRDEGVTVLVLDTDAKQAEKASGLGYMVILGDQNSFDDVLERARLDTASALFVTGTDPNSNLEITLVAHTLNPALQIVVSGENDLRRMLLEKAGASTVIDQNDIVACAMVRQIDAPQARRT